MINYNEIETVVTKTHEWSGTHAELVSALNAEEEVTGFKGGFEVPASRLALLVPEGLPFSSKPVMVDEDYQVETQDENGNEVTLTATRLVPSMIEVDGELVPEMEQKTWGEYAITHESTTAGEHLLTAVDFISGSKCHSGTISSSNLLIWAQDLGETNVRTKSEFKELIKITESENEL